ncbi:MAG: phytoene desaturase family protein, partial [Gemmatimonadales bacterium]
MVGSGPNGLAAAIRLARAGLGVSVLEASESPGGGVRSAELTLPGFTHDVCSTSFPLGAASPFFRRLPLAEHGLTWCHPPAPLAHPFDDGSAALLLPSLEDTASRLGRDGQSWKRLFDRIVDRWDDLLDDILRPLEIPLHPDVTIPFGMRAIRSAAGLATQQFDERPARALFSGCAAHGFLSLDTPGTAAFGLVLAGSAHAAGWPLVEGGSGRLTDALVATLKRYGGTIETGRTIRSFDELPPARAALFDVTPRQLDLIAGRSLPRRYARRLQSWRYGPGVFKLDLALDGPIPWTNAECGTAGTVHLGGTMEEIAAAEEEAARGRHPARPFVLLTQPSLF